GPARGLDLLAGGQQVADQPIELVAALLEHAGEREVSGPSLATREVSEQGLAELIVKDLDATGIGPAARANPLQRPQPIERATEPTGIELGEAADLGRIERTVGDREHP